MTDRHEDLLRLHLREGDDPPAPLSGRDLLGMAAARRRREQGAAAVVTALAACLVLGLSLALPDAEELRPRGGETLPGLRLLHFVDSPDGPSRASGAEVAPERAVVFAVESARSGFACIEEEAGSGWQRLAPAEGAGWRVEAGLSFLAAQGRPLAFRTDRGPGERAYRVLFSEDDPACRRPVARGMLTLTWSESAPR